MSLNTSRFKVHQLGNITIYDPVTQTREKLIQQFITVAKQAQYYPENLPEEKIEFRYKIKADWTLAQAANSVYMALRTANVPNIEIQVYFLVEFFKTRLVPCDVDFMVGKFEYKIATKTIPSDLFMKFVPETGATSDVSSLNCPADLYEGLAAWLLIQARICKSLEDKVRKQYVEGLLRNLKTLTASPPFNLPVADLVNFPSDGSVFKMTANNPQILILGSLYDYYSCATTEQKYVPLRYSTLTLRYHDHIAVHLLDALMGLGCLDINQLVMMAITPGLAKDIRRILKPGKGIDKSFSLTPYSRSMDLIQRSMFSLTENPYFCTFAAVMVGGAGTPNQTLITKTGVFVDYEISTAMKLLTYIGGSVRLGVYARKDEVIDDLDVEELDKTVGLKDFPKMRERIIRELKVQNGLPTKEELDQLRTSLSTVPKRDWTLCEYIRTMRHYTPPKVTEADLINQLLEAEDTITVAE